MDTTRTPTICSLRGRQLALLEAECQRLAMTNNPSGSLGPYRRIGHSLDSVSGMLFSVATPTRNTHQQIDSYGSGLLRTPTTEVSPRGGIPRYGPIGGERRPRSSPDIFRLMVPTSFNIQIFQPTPRLPDDGPALEEMVNEAAASIYDSSKELFPLPNFRESIDPGFAWDSPDPSYSPFPQSPADELVEPVTPVNLRVSVAGQPLSDRVDQLLNQLDGTKYMEHNIWERLCMLLVDHGPISECIRTIVGCVVREGTVRSYPSNMHVVDFCAYLLHRSSRDWVGSGDCWSLSFHEADFRAALFATFKESWSPSPKAALPSRLLLRVSSFYGHLYIIGVLYEEEFKACLNFLLNLSPLPRGGMVALLSGDIESHQELST